MTHTPEQAQRESLLLRVLWMLVFLLIWHLAELLLAGVVLFQLISRIVQGAPNASLLAFGDCLSQYLAQIGRFGTFNTETKPWPFSEWPSARQADGEAAPVTASPVPPTPAANAPVASVEGAPHSDVSDTRLADKP